MPITSHCGVWGQVRPADLALLLVALALLLSCVLLITAWTSRKLLRFTAADAVVLEFCGSTKSLASGLPIASVLFTGSALGLIILPLMLFHQMQLITCAILARQRGERGVMVQASAPAET